MTKNGSTLLIKRAEGLLQGFDFWQDFDQLPGTPEDFLAVGHHNLKQYDRFTALDAELRERIDDALSNIIADALQAEALQAHGTTDEEGIREILHGWCNQPENLQYFKGLSRLAKEAVQDYNLSEGFKSVLDQYFDAFPTIICDFLIDITRRVKLIPRARAQSIATALADMMEEPINEKPE